MPPHSRLPLPAALSSTRGPSRGLAHTARQGRMGQRRRSRRHLNSPCPPHPLTQHKHLLRARHGLRGSRFIRGPSEQPSPTGLNPASYNKAGEGP